MAMVTTAAQCDANNTKVGFADWGETWIRCNTTRGLRSWIDSDGVKRYACAAPGHRRNVERRFGVLETAEPCRFCHRLGPILDGTYQRFVDPHEGIFLACDDCVAKADLDE